MNLVHENGAVYNADDPRSVANYRGRYSPESQMRRAVEATIRRAYAETALNAPSVAVSRRPTDGRSCD